MNKQLTVAIGLSSVISLAAGSCAGFFAARSRMEKLYARQAAEEIEAAKKFYSAMYKRPPFQTPESAVDLMIPVDEAAKAIQTYQGLMDAVSDKPWTDDKITVDKDAFAGSVIEPGKPIDVNIFKDTTEVDPDTWAKLFNNRALYPSLPYILTKEEFLQAEPDYNQITLTYYGGDETLADERDQPVEDVDKTVGELNLFQFGCKSDDPNVVYIRNEPLGLDFEILRSSGAYSEEVLGFSRDKAPPRRRDRG